MRRLLPYILVAVAAGAIVLYQPFAVFGADDFTLTSDRYKVFTYGFPFRIVDCAAHLPMHMEPWQVALRFVGNFAVFFFCGAFTIQAVRYHRRRDSQHEQHAT